MRTLSCRIMVVMIGALSTACGTDRAPTSELAIHRDSAGVEIYEFDGELPSTRVDLERVWTYGHAPGEYEFQVVFQGGLQADGAALVADLGNSEVVLVDAAGSDHLVLAQSGEGPSEVRGPRGVARAGEAAFWVQDAGNAKLMLFDHGVVSRAVSTQGDRNLTFALRPLGTSLDGRILMATASYRSDFQQDWLDGHLVLFDPTTRALDTVGAFPMASRRPETGINPFQGGGVVSSAAGGFVHARMDRPEVIWRDADGSVSRIVRWNPQPRYPTDAMFDEFIAFLQEDLVRVNPGMSAEAARQFADEQVARYALDRSVALPHFGLIHGSADGGVWMDDFESGTPRTSRYVVISGEGDRAGLADFGEAFTVLDVTADRVLGVVTDAFGVQALALYRYVLGE